MKYVISDKGEVAVGYGYHMDLARDFEGQVVGAGHCEIKVSGGSIGFNMESKPEDAIILEEFLAKKV